MFLLENQASDDRAREDIRGMVRVKGKMRRKHASEVKPVYFSSPPGDTMRGLYRNRAGLGKVPICGVPCFQGVHCHFNLSK